MNEGMMTKGMMMNKGTVDEEDDDDDDDDFDFDDDDIFNEWRNAGESDMTIKTESKTSIYCWENSSFDAMLSLHVVPWQNLKVKRFFHFCLVYFIFFTFRPFAFPRYKICPTCMEPCNELIICCTDGPVAAFHLIGCLSFCMLRVAVKLITHLHLFLCLISMHLGLLRFNLHV